MQCKNRKTTSLIGEAAWNIAGEMSDNSEVAVTNPLFIDANTASTLFDFAAISIPIIGIAGGIWASVTKRTQQHREEMARIQATQSSTLDAGSRLELTALRHELAALRDTTTQYDISVERNMQELMQRLNAMEAGITPPRVGAPTIQPTPLASRADYNLEIKPQQPEEPPMRLQAGS